MFRLASILYTIISATLAGIFFITALATGNDTLVPILAAVAAGYIVALPATYFITKMIMENA